MGSGSRPPTGAAAAAAAPAGTAWEPARTWILVFVTVRSADSCRAADAAAAGVQALLPKDFGFAQAVRYLRSVPGVRGGVFVVGERIGLAGSVEIAG